MPVAVAEVLLEPSSRELSLGSAGLAGHQSGIGNEWFHRNACNNDSLENKVVYTVTELVHSHCSVQSGRRVLIRTMSSMVEGIATDMTADRCQTNLRMGLLRSWL